MISRAWSFIGSCCPVSSFDRCSFSLRWCVFQVERSCVGNSLWYVSGFVRFNEYVSSSELSVLFPGCCLYATSGRVWIPSRSLLESSANKCVVGGPWFVGSVPSNASAAGGWLVNVVGCGSSGCVHSLGASFFRLSEVVSCSLFCGSYCNLSSVPSGSVSLSFVFDSVRCGCGVFRCIHGSLLPASMVRFCCGSLFNIFGGSLVPFRLFSCCDCGCAVYFCVHVSVVCLEGFFGCNSFVFFCKFSVNADDNNGYSFCSLSVSGVVVSLSFCIWWCLSGNVMDAGKQVAFGVLFSHGKVPSSRYVSAA